MKLQLIIRGNYGTDCCFEELNPELFEIELNKLIKKGYKIVGFSTTGYSMTKYTAILQKEE